MADRTNYLLGYGERLTYEVARYQGGDDKNPAYDFATAVRRIGADVTAAARLFDALPPLACPLDEAVAAITMHPRYISKSDHPASVLNQVGLRALGSKSAVITPENWGVVRHPEEAVTTVLFVAGKRASFEEWSESIAGWPDAGASREIMKFESVEALTSAERIRAIPEAQEIQLELVLHSDPEGRIVEAFEAFAAETGDVSLDLDRRRVVGNLCFMPANAARERIERLAEFTFLRVVRGMPQLRPLITPVFRVSASASDVVLPEGPAKDADAKIAVFDGGIPDDVSLSWVTEYDTTGVGPKDAGCTEHGLMVTSAALFGHMDPRRPVELPFAGVDHYRVLGDDAGSRSKGYELYDVLNRIVEVLDVEADPYQFVNLSLGPRMEMDDDDVTLWTAQLDELLGRKDILTTVAVGNDGALDGHGARVEIPSGPRYQARARSTALVRATTARRSRSPMPRSCGEQDGVVQPGAGIAERGLDVVRLQVRQVGEDLGAGETGGQEVKYVLDPDTHSPDARPPATLGRVDGDAGFPVHA